MIQIKAVILENEAVAKGIYRMVLRAPEIAKQAKPGQFVHVRCGESHPLLRRPFSVAKIEYRGPEVFPPKLCNVTLVYKVIGEGTRLLSRCRRGEKLDILGPLGNRFDLKKTEGQKVLLVGGGMGMASLSLLAEEFVQPNQSNPEVYILFGERSFSMGVYLGVDLAEGIFSNHIIRVTEDGSFGDQGTVIEPLEKGFFLKWDDMKIADFDRIYACGPWPMLKEVARIAKEASVPCQVSLESYMACGVGACLGCVIKTKKGHKRVCKDGPVFDAKEVIWDET